MDMTCPHCGNQLRSRPEWTGRTAICKSCKGRFVIPVPPSPKESQARTDVVRAIESSTVLARPAESDETPFDFLNQATTEHHSVKRSPAAKLSRRTFTLTIILGTCILALLAGVVAMRSTVPTPIRKHQIAEHTDSPSGTDTSRGVSKGKSSADTPLRPSGTTRLKIDPAQEAARQPGIAQRKDEQKKEARHQAEAAANPLVQAASQPKEPRPARIVRHSQALPKNGLREEWQAALQTATGTAESSVDVFFFLTDFNSLYDKTRFRDDESAKLINRMKIVSKAEIDIWNEALTKPVGERLISYFSNDAAALVVIIQQDLLFKEQGFDHAMSQILCQRLATIPHSAVEEVTGIGNQNSAMQNTDAALAIAKYDPLFIGNQFQPHVWQALKR